MLVSRSEQVFALAQQLEVRAKVCGLTTDAFASQVKRSIEALAFRGLEHSMGGGEEAARYADEQIAIYNKDLVTQFVYLLMQAEDKYQYKAECLADEIDAKAAEGLPQP